MATNHSNPQPDSISLAFGPNPQNGPNWDDAGAYQIAAHTSRSEARPGSRIQLKVHILGYGRIGGCKLGFYPAPYLVEPAKSTISSDLTEETDPATGASSVKFGERQVPMATQEGVSIVLAGGILHPDWDNASMFFDFTDAENLGQRVSMIATETTSLDQHSPVEFNLAIREDVNPGVYPLPLFLTYYDGYSWQKASAAPVVVVPTLYQRHELSLWCIGLIVALIVGVAAVITPFVAG